MFLLRLSMYEDDSVCLGRGCLPDEVDANPCLHGLLRRIAGCRNDVVLGHLHDSLLHCPSSSYAGLLARSLYPIESHFPLSLAVPGQLYVIVAIGGCQTVVQRFIDGIESDTSSIIVSCGSGTQRVQRPLC